MKDKVYNKLYEKSKGNFKRMKHFKIEIPKFTNLGLT